MFPSCEFLTHIATWQNSEREKGGEEREDLKKNCVCVSECTCAFTNHFRIESQRDLYLLWLSRQQFRYFLSAQAWWNDSWECGGFGKSVLKPLRADNTWWPITGQSAPAVRCVFWADRMSQNSEHCPWFLRVLGPRVESPVGMADTLCPWYWAPKIESVQYAYVTLWGDLEKTVCVDWMCKQVE